MSNKNKIASFLIAFLIAINTLSSNAQKLPKVQESSIWAPDNIKIDGKTTEWNDQFQANNIQNKIFYTISNNDNYLYLTVHADSEPGVRKILTGGLAFTVISSKGANRLRFNYPIYSVQEGVDATAPGSGFPLNALWFCKFYYNKLSSDPAVDKTKIDELIAQSNKSIVKYFKDIQVTGIKEIADTILSIYNPESIRASALLNDKMEYNYELAIPLKYLGEDIKKNGKFVYNIRMNTVPTILVKHYDAISFGPGAATATRKDGSPLFPPDEIFVYYPGDFSGEYTLAKKK